jgi:hypothetical protein
VSADRCEVGTLDLHTVDTVHRRLRKKLLNAREEMTDIAVEHARRQREASEMAALHENLGLLRALVLLDELYLEIEKELGL